MDKNPNQKKRVLTISILLLLLLGSGITLVSFGVSRLNSSETSSSEPSSSSNQPSSSSFSDSSSSASSSASSNSSSSSQPSSSSNSSSSELSWFTVSFDSDGGSLVDAQQVIDGGKVTAPATPNKTGYAFAGWFHDLTQWDFLVDTVTSDITLKAHWAIDTYMVTFDSDGGSAVASQTVAFGGLVAEPAAPIKANYTFAGWCLDSAPWDFSVNTVAGEMTLKATWTPNVLNLDNRDTLTSDSTN